MKEKPGIYTVTPYGLQLSIPNNYLITYQTGTLYVNNDNGKNVVPKLDCVEPLSNDPSGFPYAAHFSYNNPNPTVVYVAVGSNNKITTTGRYSGQPPTVFQPGSGQFKVYFDGAKMTWTLTTYNGNHSSSVAAVASSTSSKCTSGTTGFGGGVENSMAGSTLEDNLDPSAIVYPNPTKDLVTINVKKGYINSGSVQVVDSYGKIYPVSGKKLTDHSIQLDVSRLSKGVYFVRVIVDNEFKIYRVLKM